MGDPQDVESLLRILDSAVKARGEDVKKAVEHLAQYRDPRAIPALIAFMRGKSYQGEAIEAAEYALLDLKAQVEDADRAVIVAAIAEYEQEQQEKSSVLYEPRRAEPPFTFETYRAFIQEIKLLRIKHAGATSSRDFALTREVTRQLLIELPLAYRARLPVSVLARCPICGGLVREPVDTFSLSGAGWWISEPTGFGWFGRRLQRVHETLYPPAYKRYIEPSYTAECEHVQAVHYGVNLNGLIPDDVEQARYVFIGSERPGVLRPFMERAGNYSVIHALPVGRLDDAAWRPRYTAYFVTYFSRDGGAFQRSLLPSRWYELQFLWPYELMDYDLSPWAAAGKLSWLGEEASGFSVCQGLENFPYDNIPGLVGRWAANAKTGAELLPPFQGVGLYLPRKLPIPLAAEEKAALQARGFRRITQE